MLKKQHDAKKLVSIQVHTTASKITRNTIIPVWLAQWVKAPTRAAVYSGSPWFESRDIQLDSGFFLPRSVNEHQLRPGVKVLVTSNVQGCQWCHLIQKLPAPSCLWSVSKRSRSNIVSIMPLYKSSWFDLISAFQVSVLLRRSIKSGSYITLHLQV